MVSQGGLCSEIAELRLGHRLGQEKGRGWGR